jgi:5-methylcytosine-specific restriction endonuclease McrA
VPIFIGLIMDTLVLSSAYQPMTHVSWKRAISLWFAGKVEIISVYENRFIRTVDEIFHVPSIVRFIGNVVKRFKFNRVIKFNRENVFLRDSGKCQYCAKNLQNSEYTLDHVIPASQGGKKEWQNIVACCKACNQKKSNRTPKQAGMALIKVPEIPKKLIVMAKNTMGPNCPDDWKDYLWD